MNVRINSEDIIAPQDLIQLKEMITEFEENENQFVFIEDLNLQYVQNDEMPIVKEFSPELLDDASLFDSAMTDLYLNPRGF